MPRRWLPVLQLVVALASAVITQAAFERPGEFEQRRALGNLFEIPETIRPLFVPDGDFADIRPPGPNDWLGQHTERGQTFEDFRDVGLLSPDPARRVIYFQPIGDFAEETSPAFDDLKRYAAAFFQMEVRILPTYDPHDLEFSPRRNPRSGQRQLLTTEVMDFLRSRLPRDACCVLGVTMVDLYPSATWNYVFGQASITDRVGIYSLARYDPAFWGDERGAQYQDTILRRSCKVLAHETAHMFGLHHCIYFECVVNGSNHMVETDRSPQQLCVICLRKLHLALGFDPVRRYQDLAQFYRAHRWYEEFDWVNRQLGRLPAPPVAAP